LRGEGDDEEEEVDEERRGPHLVINLKDVMSVLRMPPEEPKEEAEADDDGVPDDDPDGHWNM
jgi:hypothetical protein